ncbi:hypothetical protein ACJX0J_039381, partial [Zea mays]
MFPNEKASIQMNPHKIVTTQKDLLRYNSLQDTTLEILITLGMIWTGIAQKLLTENVIVVFVSISDSNGKHNPRKTDAQLARRTNYKKICKYMPMVFMDDDTEFIMVDKEGDGQTCYVDSVETHQDY